MPMANRQNIVVGFRFALNVFTQEGLNGNEYLDPLIVVSKLSGHTYSMIFKRSANGLLAHSPWSTLATVRSH